MRFPLSGVMRQVVWMLTAKFKVIAAGWKRESGQRSSVPPAKSARQGACATMVKPLITSVGRCMQWLYHEVVSYGPHLRSWFLRPSRGSKSTDEMLSRAKRGISGFARERDTCRRRQQPRSLAALRDDKYALGRDSPALSSFARLDSPFD